MVNGPPCPQCGFTLRWLAPQNGWGCDRCQKMFAPQQVQQPAYHTPTPPPPTPTAYPPAPTPPQHGYGQAPYSPQPQGYAPPHGAVPPPAGKSKKGLVIGLSLAGLAIAGGVIAIVLVMRGKGSAAGGSRDDVLRATFAAMASGDAGELASLSGVESFHSRVFKCKERKKQDDDESDERREWEDELRDPKKMLERTQKNAAKVVIRTKGVKIEVVEILTKEPKPLADDKSSKKKGDDESDDEDEDDRDRDRDRDEDDERTEDERDTKTFVVKKGKEIAPGCKAKETFRFQTVKVKLKLTEGTSEPIEYVARIGLTNLGSGWYLSEPPLLPVGFDALAADLEPWRERMCKCTDEKCAKSTGKELEKEYGRLERLVETERSFDDDDNPEVPKEKTEKLRQVVDELKTCAGKAAGGAVVAKMTEIKDAMCACKDKACADKVMNDMTEYSRTQSKDKMPSEDVMKQITPISKELTECMMKLMTPAAALTSLSPATGPSDGANEITLTGSGFYSSTPISVYFGMQRGTILRTESDSSLRVLAPRMMTGGEAVVDVVVNMADGKELRLPKAYTYETAEDPLPPEDVAGTSKLTPAKNLPSACERYRLVIARAQACAKYPEGAKSGFSAAWESLLKTDKTWSSQRSSVKKSITDTCELGAKTMNDALRSMGC